MSPQPEIISRHRLPTPYRIAIPLLWLAPIGVFLVVFFARTGLTPAALDPRLLLPLLLMALPALYIWQEGVDVLKDGIVRRVHVPRYYPYTVLDDWQHSRDVLVVWDRRRRKALECRPAHLTDVHLLLAALRDNVPLPPPYQEHQHQQAHR